MNRTEDRLLVARLQARDETAVHELAERYGSRIYQLALRQMKNREDAEEVTQDVLMKVYRKIGAFRGDSALSSWIYRITFNTAMSRLRTSKLARAAQQQERNRDGEDENLRAIRAARRLVEHAGRSVARDCSCVARWRRRSRSCRRSIECRWCCATSKG